MADRGYINLLSHLNRTSTTLPLSTVQSSIAHYLARVQPLPTSFTAIVISSQLFRALTLPKLQAVSVAFRHGVHFKVKLLQGEPTGLFSQNLRSRLGEWVYAILNGLQGGQTMLRLAAYSGLLLGLEDWERDLTAKDSRMRGKVEEELVVTLAEAMDMYPLNPSSVGWESEFVPNVARSEGSTLSIAYLIASRSLLLVASHRLKALPLGALTSTLLAIIESAFRSGTFLSTLESSVTRNLDGKLVVSPDSPFPTTLHALSSSPIISSMPSLSRLCALALSALADSRPQQGWLVMSEAMQKLESLTRAVEADWLRSRLSSVSDENDIASESRDIATEIWSVLKTLLFTNIMVVQSVLSTLVYVPQPSRDSPAFKTPAEQTPYSFALTALHIFSHLSFVLPQFGGVTSTARDSFVELKKVFYTALDILSSDPQESERFIRLLCDDARSQAKSHALPLHFTHAKKAYSLACIEQLVPVLNDDIIRTDVYPMCEPHLSDPSHRETYESAHSVMLAVFVSHAHKASDDTTKAHKSRGPAFAEQIVPSYAQCLVDNSNEGGLSDSQLCLAFPALVRSAGSFGTGQVESGPPEGDAFAWLCIETLLHAIHPPPTSTASSSITKVASPANISAHLHRLYLTLVAAIPSVSLLLLPRLLDEVRTVIESYPPSQVAQRDELIQAAFREVSQNVGDLEKEYAMEWWHDQRERLASSGHATGIPPSDRSDGLRAGLISRL